MVPPPMSYPPFIAFQFGPNAYSLLKAFHERLCSRRHSLSFGGLLELCLLLVAKDEVAVLPIVPLGEILASTMARLMRAGKNFRNRYRLSYDEQIPEDLHECVQADELCRVVMEGAVG